MATILAIQPRLAILEVKRRPERAIGEARVIIFPGVRYERIPEVSAVIAKSAKKNRKIA
jgi:hypothetical protein